MELMYLELRLMTLRFQSPYDGRAAQSVTFHQETENDYREFLSSVTRSVMYTNGV